MAVELLPENLLAWEVYWVLRLNAVADTVLDLRSFGEDPRGLNPWEADDLALKLEVLAMEFDDIEADRMKELEQERKRASRFGRP